MPERRRTTERNERIGREAAEQDLDAAGAEAPGRERPPADAAGEEAGPSGQDAAKGQAVRSDVGGSDGPSVRRSADEGQEGSGDGAVGDAQPRDQGRAHGGAAGDERGPRGQARDDRLTAGDAAKAGMRGISELVRREPVGVTAVSPRHDGWLVGVEVVELRRLPSSADILALYEAELDMDGTLRSYRRTKQYTRGRGEGG